jgi:hypothetical protein
MIVQKVRFENHPAYADALGGQRRRMFWSSRSTDAMTMLRVW